MTRVVLVTGGGTGIGRAVAARFVEEGARVVITGRRADRLEAAVGELALLGASVEGAPGETALGSADGPSGGLAGESAGGLAGEMASGSAGGLAGGLAGGVVGGVVGGGAERPGQEFAGVDGRVIGVVCDAADPAQVAVLAARVGAPDVLVNAAGGLPESRPAVTVTGRDGAGGDGAGGDEGERLAAVGRQWESAFAQNVLTAVLTTAAFEHLLQPGASVISIGSIAAERRGGSYGAAKAALAAWNAFQSAALGPRGITCNVIAPGYIEATEFFRDGLTEERRALLIEETHDKRPGTPDDLARTVAFLASAGARHITGQTLHVNGGAHTTR
ncbi:SDR family NAD(P)-dependent oxidoreductase [Nonomuraea soli]|uniref:NAD(P)-dependent dehydrogenase (Short-subunit alcohol dehydrogenase family) n=1 Tax=Nonomuraea soli TaxID=1032476 RepID=A0A7W0CGI5_9ACTN|nr:SDR family oxidoreductase [Nonomuraea soli]MBA2890582.1 NAD(P)-dependent dehydrogenase (short-subunit alcohol dehydrogenase family) [Nonomuraea soli]